MEKNPLKGGGNQRSRADKKGEGDEECRGQKSQMELEEEQRRRVQTWRRGRTNKQRKRVEKFREEVSFFRIDDVTNTPEKNPGILR